MLLISKSGRESCPKTIFIVSIRVALLSGSKFNRRPLNALQNLSVMDPAGPFMGGVIIASPSPLDSS